MPSPAASHSSASSPRAPMRRWFATAMERLRLRRRRRSQSPPASPAPPTAAAATTTAPPRPPRFVGLSPFETSPPPPPPQQQQQQQNQQQQQQQQQAPPPPAPTRRAPPPPPDPVLRPRARTIPLSEIAAGRALVSWLPPAQRHCVLCQKPYDGANTDLERRTPWEEREQAVRVPGCSKTGRESHIVGRRCLERWEAVGGSPACPLCALAEDE
ncbi:hypothetical protein DIS24_g12448 [Lasiodiplodia hormozganensis]|uniref:Uncharacterized protein n=1 Tax=Lasiodiplodia hormozganensis TaxID=869390 RepID=A0AA39TZM9_9PEZI|nr:hypothetical protein DIS24_g12448 [Lasiodiplodia hormozganensis]